MFSARNGQHSENVAVKLTVAQTIDAAAIKPLTMQLLNLVVQHYVNVHVKINKINNFMNCLPCLCFQMKFLTCPVRTPIMVFKDYVL